MYPLLAALDNAADGAYVIDENQRIVYWNQAAQALLGYTADEVLGRLCHEIVQARDEQDHRWCRGNCHVVARARLGKAMETFTVCAHSKSGALRWINVSILALPVGAANGTKLVLHLFRDATEVHQRDLFARQVLNLVSGLPPAESQPVQPASLQVEQKLTGREQQVLVLLTRGLSTDEIATALSISKATTRNHIQSILQKLQVRSRAAAVSYAFEHHLVSRGD